MGRTTIVSAPGKVLVAGGYLVLDRAYSGLVIATSSRFYCAVSPHSSSTTAGPSDTAAAPSGRVVVRAGQFPADVSTWSYDVSATADGIQVQSAQGGKNKFIEITLTNALRVVVEHLTASTDDAASAGAALIRHIDQDGGLDIVVFANNDFYSQREQLTALGLPPLISSLDSLQPFNPLPRTIHETNKTGLGSSAALVSSLTAGILSYFDVVSLSSPGELTGDSTSNATAITRSDLDLVHNLSQFSHCLAQGKVGSGFDISSAVFGTHVYRRFSPSVLATLMSSTSSSVSLLSELRSEKWDHTARPFALPQGLRLMLADVDAGTDTPSFVGQVLKWREENRVVADKLWMELGIANDTLGDRLQSLGKLEDEKGYADVLAGAAKEPIAKCDTSLPVSRMLVEIQATLALIRSHLQRMSSLSDVPIEPDGQTRLLDACSALPGVLGGTVPGAGGYDAIVLLVVDTPEVVASVEKVWSKWTEMSVCPLTARQSDGGIQSETLDGVAGLRDRLGQ